MQKHSISPIKIRQKLTQFLVLAIKSDECLATTGYAFEPYQNLTAITECSQDVTQYEL